jgi:ribonuclease HII
VRGDAKCVSIAAASIVAKVTRDAMMIELGRAFPAYGFERHKGYPTPEHQAAIARHGVTAHHRRSFKTVQLALGLDPGRFEAAVEAVGAQAAAFLDERGADVA